MTVSRLLIFAQLGLLLSGAAIATTPQVQPAEQAATVTTVEEAPRTKPVNLKVLPHDIAPVSLGRLMKRYAQDLGVQCSFCHVENTATGKLDYASDESGRKQTARLMIGMLGDINDKYLAQLEGDRRYAAPVTCGSCHQGRSNPQPFEPRWR